MKKILPVLLCYVLTASQTYAISGGPVFTSGVNPVGLFSGVLEGITEVDDINGSGPVIPGDPLPSVTNGSTASNALGLFSLSVPSSNLATGTFILFEDGVVFTGTINASADSDTSKILGILEATFNFNLTTFDATGAAVVSQVTASALGRLTAKVSGALSNSGGSLGRLTGTANLDVSFGEVDLSTLQPIINRSTTFNVIGFKQSSSPTGNVTATG